MFFNPLLLFGMTKCDEENLWRTLLKTMTRLRTFRIIGSIRCNRPAIFRMKSDRRIDTPRFFCRRNCNPLRASNKRNVPILLNTFLNQRFCKHNACDACCVMPKESQKEPKSKPINKTHVSSPQRFGIRRITPRREKDLRIRRHNPHRLMRFIDAMKRLVH